MATEKHKKHDGQIGGQLFKNTLVVLGITSSLIMLGVILYFNEPNGQGRAISKEVPGFLIPITAPQHIVPKNDTSEREGVKN